ncbi:hypothetical protein Ocin01_19240 [Orchesella cincta]|uniref:Uncharacterized protein n=1 Tax=Orchesella cincta TaxID=48709 RepID=A0A1D2M3D0_ORCCI|nr:hypothetical protein Ocin01_19240 [Orchesella cincta]
MNQTETLWFCEQITSEHLNYTRQTESLLLFVGQLLFDESVSLMWWLGTLLIVFGLFLMNYGGQVELATGKRYRKRKQKSR